MTKELATHDDFTTQLAEFDKIQDTCKKLMATKHYQKLGEEGIHVIMAKCKALGIHPFEGLNGGFFVVQGKVGMSTEMMAALARKRGHSIKKDPKSNNELVILHGKRADNGDTWTCSFSRQDAESAGLWSQATWKKYPGVMLYNRCMSMMFRQLFPDLSLGAGYVEDELKEITRTGDYDDRNTIDVSPSQFIESLKTLPEELKQIGNVKPLYTPEEQKQTEEMVTAQQSIELIQILEECHPDYKKHFLETAMPANFKCRALSDLPKKHYEKVKNAFLLKRDENFAMQQAEFEQGHPKAEVEA